MNQLFQSITVYKDLGWGGVEGERKKIREERKKKFSPQKRKRVSKRGGGGGLVLAK